MPWIIDKEAQLQVSGIDPSAPNGVYDHCRIGIDRDPDTPMIIINVSYGYMFDGEYVRGAVRPALPATHVIQDDDLAKIRRKSFPLTSDKKIEGWDKRKSKSGDSFWIESTYDASKRGLYEHLADKKIIPPGAMT